MKCTYARTVDTERKAAASPIAALRLQVPATPAAGRGVRAALSSFLETRPPLPNEFDIFMTAVGEAIANAIEHSKSLARIDVRVSLDSEFLFVTISDMGIGFTPKMPTLETGELPPWDSERGRGFAIMRRCTDLLCIDSESGKGTTILLGIRR